jgi:hypothetical protein
MPPGQALGIALLFALAVLGFHLILWRSTAPDKTGSYLRRVMNALSVSMLAGGGTGFLLLGEPNVVIAVAGGILFYSSAFNHGFMAWHEYQGRTSSHPSLRSMLRFYFGARAVAGCVCAIGSLIYGGAMGLLGAFLSAWWSLFHFWVLKRVTREAADRPQQA